jgi:hypothetical protein
MPVSTAKLPDRICFETKLQLERVNDGGFADVALITGDTEALGHGIFVDRKGVEQLAAMLVGKSLPSYITHEGALWSDRLGKEIGYFSGNYFDPKSGKLRGQFSFMKSFMKHEAASYERLVEMAETMPEQFGVSIVFSGKLAWVMEDGSEVGATSYDPPEGSIRDIPTVRFTRIESADFVKSPAANADGLFAAPVDASGKGMANAQIITFSQADLDAKLAEATTAHAAALSEALAAKDATHLAALDALKAEHATALAAKDEAHTAALSTLKTEHAAALATAKANDAALLGTPPAVATAKGDDQPAAAALPEPAKGINERWDQYAALKETDPAAAERFFAAHIAPKPAAPRGARIFHA